MEGVNHHCSIREWSIGICKQGDSGPWDATLTAEHKTKDAKARGIILDGVKDHIIPHITGKDSSHQMWIALIKLYQSDNQNRKMVLREKLNSIKMNRSETMASYFTRIRD